MQAKFTYSPLGKPFEKQTEKQVNTMKFLKPSFDKPNELKQIENIFSLNQMNNLIIDKLKVIKQLQSLIKLNELGYRTKKSGRNFDFSKYSLPVVFLRDIHEGVLEIKDADKEQSKLSCILNNVKKKILRDKKSIF